MAHPLLDDTFVRAMVDDAMEPWASRLVPEERAWLEDQLAVLLQLDPELASLLKGAHPRQLGPGAIDRSGERGPLGIDAPSSEAEPVAGNT